MTWGMSLVKTPPHKGLRLAVPVAVLAQVKADGFRAVRAAVAPALDGRLTTPVTPHPADE